MQEALRAKGIDPQTGKVEGTGLYIRELQEIERRERERRDLEAMERSMASMGLWNGKEAA